MHFSHLSYIVALANTFSSLFISKISVIHSSFPSDSHSRVLNPPDTRKVLQNLTCVTADEVYCLVLLARCTSLDLDPRPTSFMKDCIDILISLMTSIVNLSLTEGSFPSHFKSALVSPLWKDLSHNKDSMFNLSFLFKVHDSCGEPTKFTQNRSNTSNNYQSAYRKFHLTETELYKSITTL